ncbi:MAG: hypothetical protein ABI852_11680, partial [Gemmatimonadaceae bacterium]
MLSSLITATGALPDRRLFSVLVRTSRDTSRSTLDRVAALASLGAYLNPSYIATIIDNPNRPGQVTADLNYVSHKSTSTGSQQLANEDFAAIRALARELDRKGENSELRSMA